MEGDLSKMDIISFAAKKIDFQEVFAEAAQEVGYPLVVPGEGVGSFFLKANEIYNKAISIAENLVYNIMLIYGFDPQDAIIATMAVNSSDGFGILRAMTRALKFRRATYGPASILTGEHLPVVGRSLSFTYKSFDVSMSDKAVRVFEQPTTIAFKDFAYFTERTYRKVKPLGVSMAIDSIKSHLDDIDRSLERKGINLHMLAQQLCPFGQFYLHFEMIAGEHEAGEGVRSESDFERKLIEYANKQPDIVHIGAFLERGYSFTHSPMPSPSITLDVGTLLYELQKNQSKERSFWVWLDRIAKKRKRSIASVKYVIAHELGHAMEKVLGVAGKWELVHDNIFHSHIESNSERMDWIGTGEITIQMRIRLLSNLIRSLGKGKNAIFDGISNRVAAFFPYLLASAVVMDNIAREPSPAGDATHLIEKRFVMSRIKIGTSLRFEGFDPNYSEELYLLDSVVKTVLDIDPELKQVKSALARLGIDISDWRLDRYETVVSLLFSMSRTSRENEIRSLEQWLEIYDVIGVAVAVVGGELGVDDEKLLYILLGIVEIYAQAFLVYFEVMQKSSSCFITESAKKALSHVVFKVEDVFQYPTRYSGTSLDESFAEIFAAFVLDLPLGSTAKKMMSTVLRSAAEHIPDAIDRDRLALEGIFI